MAGDAPIICVSATPRAAEALRHAGPRRDFLELEERTGGRCHYQAAAPGRGLAGKLLGPHVRQAIRASAEADDGMPIFADGEHIGIPLLAMLWLRRRRCPVTILAHMPARRWKRPLLWLATRLRRDGMLLVHSARQRDAVSDLVPGGWTVELTPYQVDTAFWTDPAPAAATSEVPLFLAVGAENRDYATLLEAAAIAGSRARFVIAAGSHWARKTRSYRDPPPNVEFIEETLDFSALREWYRRARAVVVPLADVENQSGITTMLEAMSMAKPVVVTATRGQRECIVGPLVHADGRVDAAATADRGPQAFDSAAYPDRWSGLYVPPRDGQALARALTMLSEDPAMAAELGEAGRAYALRHFRVEQYVDRLAASIGTGATVSRPAVPVQP